MRSLVVNLTKGVCDQLHNNNIIINKYAEKRVQRGSECTSGNLCQPWFSLSSLAFDALVGLAIPIARVVLADLFQFLSLLDHVPQTD